MDVIFIMSKQMPQRIYEVKINPRGHDLKKFDDICKARGEDDHMVVCLTGIQLSKISPFIDTTGD